MRKITLLFCLVLLAFGAGHISIAQDTAATPAAKNVDSAKPAPPVHYYHLDLIIEDLDSDGKPVNSRTYSTTVGTGPRNGVSIRTGSRIPVATGSNEANGKTEVTQFQYIDLGVNIDVNEVHEVGNQLAISLTAHLTGLAQAIEPNLHQPVIRENRWQAPVLIPVGKPSVAFKSDSLDTKGATRVLVTATLIQ